MIILKGKLISKFKNENYGIAEILGKNGTGFQVFRVRFFKEGLNELDKYKLEENINIPISINTYNGKVQYNYSGD